MEKRLGDFEEVLMLLVGIVSEEDAYAYRITVEFKAQTGRSLSIGAAHSTLDRLEDKGFLRSQMREGTTDRGERSKRIYQLTALGKRVLRESMEMKTSLWKQYPDLASMLNLSY
ncbi:MAG TPA: helix-turn-helix transcriptional regulator [Cyclobacteriaceae bacterium]|nr:helix-turn-helix transcriptional regulator [Cyclobacteriaceae bacterium]